MEGRYEGYTGYPEKILMEITATINIKELYENGWKQSSGYGNGWDTRWAFPNKQVFDKGGEESENSNGSCGKTEEGWFYQTQEFVNTNRSSAMNHGKARLQPLAGAWNYASWGSLSQIRWRWIQYKDCCMRLERCLQPGCTMERFLNCNNFHVEAERCHGTRGNEGKQTWYSVSGVWQGCLRKIAAVFWWNHYQSNCCYGGARSSWLFMRHPGLEGVLNEERRNIHLPNVFTQTVPLIQFGWIYERSMQFWKNSVSMTMPLL